MKVVKKEPRNQIEPQNVRFDKHIVAVLFRNGRVGVCARRERWKRRIVYLCGNMEAAIGQGAESVEALLREPAIKEVHAFTNDRDFFQWAAKVTK